MTSAALSFRGFALTVGTLALFALPAVADVQECIEGCRQQVCADREACEELLNPESSGADAWTQRCAAAFPVGSSKYRACMRKAPKAKAKKTSADYRRCINLANTSGAACARGCAPSPNEPFPVPIPGPVTICP